MLKFPVMLILEEMGTIMVSFRDVPEALNWLGGCDRRFAYGGRRALNRVPVFISTTADRFPNRPNLHRVSRS